MNTTPCSASRLAAPQSTKLAVYEERLQGIVHSTAHLPEQLASTGKVGARQAQRAAACEAGALAVTARSGVIQRRAGFPLPWVHTMRHYVRFLSLTCCNLTCAAACPAYSLPSSGWHHRQADRAAHRPGVPAALRGQPAQQRHGHARVLLCVAAAGASGWVQLHAITAVQDRRPMAAVREAVSRCSQGWKGCACLWARVCVPARCLRCTPADARSHAPHLARPQGRPPTTCRCCTSACASTLSWRRAWRCSTRASWCCRSSLTCCGSTRCRHAGAGGDACRLGVSRVNGVARACMLSVGLAGWGLLPKLPSPSYPWPAE